MGTAIIMLLLMGVVATVIATDDEPMETLDKNDPYFKEMEEM